MKGPMITEEHRGNNRQRTIHHPSRAEAPPVLALPELLDEGHPVVQHDTHHHEPAKRLPGAPHRLKKGY